MPDGLTVAELVLACVVLIALVPVLWLVARRLWLSSSGWVFECSLRRPDSAPSSSWVLGVARLNGDVLQWYRMFSWSLRPRLELTRGQARVTSTRSVAPTERVALRDQDRVATLRSADGRVELAMAPVSMTAVLSWLEAAPPGYGYH